MKQLRTAIEEISPIPEEELTEILSYFKEEKFKKKQVVERSGQTYKKLYYIASGMARLYYERADRDITGWFSKEGQFVTANDSFFQKKPSHLNLEFLEDSVAYTLHIGDIEELFEKYHSFERFGRILSYQSLSTLSEHMYTMLFQTAEKRYQLLSTHSPEIVSRAPLGDIASFLGISQETLSRIRASIAGKK